MSLVKQWYRDKPWSGTYVNRAMLMHYSVKRGYSYAWPVYAAFHIESMAIAEFRVGSFYR